MQDRFDKCVGFKIIGKDHPVKDIALRALPPEPAEPPILERFLPLLERNPYCVGWIRIDGTCIEEGEKQFDYHVYLMKWGADWSAVDEIDQPPLMEWYNVYRDNGFEMPRELP